MARPCTSERPVEYPAKPKAIRSKKGLANLPKGQAALLGIWLEIIRYRSQKNLR